MTVEVIVLKTMSGVSVTVLSGAKERCVGSKDGDGDEAGDEQRGGYSSPGNDYDGVRVMTLQYPINQ